ncbi:hypothetical protein CEXT_804201 [Caerostris extrusa]|uniref:Uncharacterized protein n=1 Tax=Caerostris extrusa TaxID=172846 RepID=A0AAV4N208_CAEEX|nr:hypothetical protein CEXT_804201 [Caerostris extrusa]
MMAIGQSPKDEARGNSGGENCRPFSQGFNISTSNRRHIFSSAKISRDEGKIKNRSKGVLVEDGPPLPSDDFSSLEDNYRLIKLVLMSNATENRWKTRRPCPFHELIT